LVNLSLSFGEDVWLDRAAVEQQRAGKLRQLGACALWRELFMRTLRLALVVSRVTLEQSKIFAVTRVVAIVVATTTMVLGASFVAVALSLA
jgi:hypothetical protein